MTAADYIDGQLHTDYSGRGADGEHCVGLSGRIDGFTLAGIVVEAAAAHGLNIHQTVAMFEELGPVRADQLGCDTVAYWPRVRA